jgi:hypothetical protein
LPLLSWHLLYRLPTHPAPFFGFSIKEVMKPSSVFKIPKSEASFSATGIVAMVMSAPASYVPVTFPGNQSGIIDHRTESNVFAIKWLKMSQTLAYRICCTLEPRRVIRVCSAANISTKALLNALK